MSEMSGRGRRQDLAVAKSHAPKETVEESHDEFVLAQIARDQLVERKMGKNVASPIALSGEFSVSSRSMKFPGLMSRWRIPFS